MFEDDPEKLEELVDALYELKHDLGKYIRLPVAMLPKEAPLEDVIAAVTRGIDRTRNGPRGVRSARDIWRAFHAEWGDALGALEIYEALGVAVERAVGWSAQVAAADSEWRRADVERDLTAVGRGIEALLVEVERSG